MDTSIEPLNVSIRQSAIGRIGIARRGEVITNLFFAEGATPSEPDAATSPLLDEAFRQLDAWLSGQITAFSLPLAPEGTEFMRQVWQALSGIPYGETSTYLELALRIGAPGAARAVGNACGRNPLPIFIPCHRVVRNDGNPGGYLGGPELKRTLLDLERRYRDLFRWSK